MFVYQMAFPVDDFGAMMKFKYLFKRALAAEADLEKDYCHDGLSTFELRSLLRRTLRSLARVESYWEGDVRGDDLYIGSVPTDNDYTDMCYFLIIKQDNNGSSFLVSELEFFHLAPALISSRIERPVSLEMQEKLTKILDKFAPDNN